jgi:myo-inositol 2-dehydrogenase/D-chiro-inositol 1-dehydrogenase
MFHSVHRNASVPRDYTGTMAITDTAVHDFDVARWLLEEELTAVRVVAARQNSRREDVRDPLFTIVETTSGALVDVETSVSIGYGYDIRGELVGETGTVALVDEARVTLRSGGRAGVAVEQDWRQRFETAYDRELESWIAAVADGRGATGASAWDGYAAQAAADAGTTSLVSGERVPVRLVDRPALYG